MEKHQMISIAGDILRLHKLCYKDGKCIDGKMWNNGSDLIREKHNIDMFDWTYIKQNYVDTVLAQLKKGK